MAYYALINKDNIVVQVITGIDENIIQTDTDGIQVGGSTEAWEKFYESLPWFRGLICKRTSYNTGNNQHRNGGIAFRGNFAAIGYKYDSDFDIFIPPQPYPSWKFDYQKCDWYAPITKPEDGQNYKWKWSEVNQEWVQVEIPSQE